MDCNSCKEKHRQSEPIPYIAYESGMARLERTIQRLWILLIILIVLLVGSNIGWLIYESQFEEVVTTEIEQDTGEGGDNYIVGGDYNGTAKD